VLERLRFVRVVAETAGQSRVVEDERDADERHAGGNRPLDSEREQPCRRRRRLKQRVGRRLPDRLGITRRQQRCRPALEHRLG
jgi:hypothetical protein